VHVGRGRRVVVDAVLGGRCCVTLAAERCLLRRRDERELVLPRCGIHRAACGSEGESDERREREAANREGHAGFLRELMGCCAVAGEAQYLGTDWSTSRDHASMPPVRLRSRVKPCSRRNSSARWLRMPWWQARMSVRVA